MSKALIDPPGDWERVSPRLVAVQEISNLITSVIFLAVVAAPLLLRRLEVWPGYPEWISWALGALVLLFGAIEAIVVPFRVRNMSYALRADDVCVARGVIFHQSEVIPYGRIQYVDVKAGPLLRAFGLCVLQVHTASPDAHPRIDGLLREDGERLRDELARRGEERLAGL
ncbi:hypothetical protein DWB68_15025 [Galactobacter valiniphilus]|uniref:YdbS-like PH domain-containing protein n=1 Tax=Galactobacter valiniphilus TaxID=2676122 RepID=A0A399J9X6_9MICC|nr:PH domain-containing protein [Galactobacter valiniphilus]RII40989.1 hypothetical protein DWB68_15025 [Galactobacter valiniphilus]